MKNQMVALVALVASLWTGSRAAGQSVLERRPLSLRDASSLAVPPDSFGNASGGALPSNSALTRAQIKRGSRAGKTANVALAAFVGGLVGFFAVAATGVVIQSENCYVIGAPIGAVAGGALAATYVHRRQHP